MGEIKGKDVFEQSAIEAPLEFSKNMDKAIDSVDELIVKMKKGEKEIGLAKSTKKVRQENEKLITTNTELAKVQKQVSTARSKDNEEVRKRQRELIELRKKQKDLIETEGRELGTLEKLARSNKKLTEERKKLNLETTKGQKRLKQINGQLDKNNKAINKNNDALGKQKANIGNYSSALQGLPGPLGRAVGGIQAMTRAAIAFIATPLGAVLAAIVAALATLGTFFHNSAEGQNALTKTTAAAAVVWNNLKDIIADVGKFLFAVATFDAKLAGEAIEDATGKIKNFVAETKSEIAIQNRLSDIRIKNIALQRELLVEEAKIRRDVALLREEAAVNEEINAAKSAQLIREAITLEDQLAAKREEVAKNNLLLITEENKLAGSTNEELDKQFQAEAALINIQTQRAQAAKRLQKELNTLEKKAATQAKKNLDDSKKAVILAVEELENLDPQFPSFADAILPETDVDLIKSRLEKLAEEIAEGQKKIADIERAGRAERANSIIDGAQQAFEVFKGFSDLRIQQISDELTALEFARNRDLENAGDNERSKKEINLKADAQRRELQKKQLNQEKAQALFSIAINTARGITAALASVPPNPVLAAAIGVIGATQAAAVLSRKIPEFDKGTESTPDTYIAGEKRPEIRKSKGKFSLVDSPTLFTKSRGDKIISGKETANILGGMSDLGNTDILSNPGLMLGLLNGHMHKPTENFKIERKLDDVVKAIKGKKELELHVSGQVQKRTYKDQYGNLTTYANKYMR